jgi:bifunctional non-homologous end joining protein LigD
MREMTAEGHTGELRKYGAKRDFARTPEPAPTKTKAARGGEAKRGAVKRGKAKTRFVVHEHHARRLHWDLRLEHEGALMSWAVPNGIPQDPSENRKAIHVEDHPLSYIDFEGEIPHGNYGAGRVLIWDRGSYEFEKFEDGKLVVVFRGKRLRGRFALFRAGREEKDWMIHRMDPPAKERVQMPRRLSAMLATAAALPRRDEGWAYEVKWDGVRALTYWQPGRMRIESRNLNDISSRYPELRALGRQLGAREALLDGEIVAFDQDGKPSFERLQRRMHVTSESVIRRLASEHPVIYEIFDLLYLDGRSTLALSYRERRALLAELKLEGVAWQTPAYHVGSGRDFFAVTAEHGLEGVLAKRLDSTYRPGERGGDWLKVKNVNRQELVIGGWLPGSGRRRGQLGALLMGYQEEEGDRQVLRYAGRVGTGFDEDELGRLGEELAARKRLSSPFAKRGVQPPREARFVEPELVAEIEFSHWTRQRILRHSAYKGLRSDKPATEVFEESPAESSRASKVLEESPAEPSCAYRVLHETKRHTEIEAQGRTLRLSNREKVLYPRTGFTKGQLIDFYAALAPVVLGHLAGRPLTFKRYPDGVDGEYFYEKRCPSHRPDWVQTAAIWSERQETPIDYCLVEDLPTLIWIANLADIELHTSLSLARDMETPTGLVFDLDPGEGAGLRACCRVALAIKELFDAFALQTFVKTSGLKGMQVYVPLNTPISYEQTKPFARAVAELLAKKHPELVVSRMTRNARGGKVLIDWSQNDPHKTTVCVYSLRAQERPTVSTPLSWEEVGRGSRRRSEPQLSLEPAALLERVASEGDLFALMLGLTQTLPALSGQEAARSRAGEGAARSPSGKEEVARSLADRKAARFYEASGGGSSRAGGKPKDNGGVQMPPRGVKKGSKRERQYEHIKDSERERGASEGRAEEIAARTANKERARSGESRTRSRTSTKDISSSRRGGLRSGKPGPRGRTREQLYQEARKLGVEGRSSMNKAQLQRAVDAKKS